MSFRSSSAPAGFRLCLIAAWIFGPWINHSSAQVYAFADGEHIAVASLQDPAAPAKRLVLGNDPAISPDGKRVAYTEFDDDGNRFIAIVEIATGKANRVAGIPGENEFMAFWSVDGKRLVFHHFGESDWLFAQVDAAGGNFRLVNPSLNRQAGAYGALPNGNGWLCHDLDSFFVIGPDRIEEVPGTSNVPGLSMPSHLDVAASCRSALIVRSVEEDMGPDSEGPPSAIFLLDLQTGAQTRLTSKGWDAICPSWIPGGDEFLFSAFDAKTMSPSIYRMKAEPGAKPVLVRAGGSWPSVPKGLGSSR